MPASGMATAKFIGRIEYADFVLGWHVGLDVVNVIENVPAAEFERPHALPHMRSNFLWNAARQNPLSVTFASSEDGLITKFAFESLRFHVCR